MTWELLQEVILKQAIAQANIAFFQTHLYGHSFFLIGVWHHKNYDKPM